MFNLYALVGNKLKYFIPFAAQYHLTCRKNNINAIIINAIINAAYQLKNVCHAYVLYISMIHTVAHMINSLDNCY